jgi:hypothetical protein
LTRRRKGPINAPDLGPIISRLICIFAGVAMMAACVPPFGIGAKFTLTNARVDPSYSCPRPSDHRPYDVHVTIDAGNTTSSAVTIKSIQETWRNVAVRGDWQGVLGDHGTTSVSAFTPKTVGSGSNSTLRFVVSFQCSNSGPTVETYGDFAFTFVVSTSAGSFTLNSANQHRLRAT